MQTNDTIDDFQDRPRDIHQCYAHLSNKVRCPNEAVLNDYFCYQHRITPAPIYDPDQTLPDFTDFMVLFRPGDIVKFAPIDRERYDELLAEVEAGTFHVRTRPVEFRLQPFLDDPDGYNARLLEALK